MKPPHLILLLFFFNVETCWSIVIRHDVPNDIYSVDNPPEYLIDMPYEGHGVLIDSNWVVTVAHVIFENYIGKELVISGKPYLVENVVIHPDYQTLPQELFQGNSDPLMLALKSRSDIALLKLKDPVKDVEPIEIYEGGGEANKIIEIFGKGATGDGLTGENIETKGQKTLRHCKNIISGVEQNWIYYEFDSPEDALPLEGMHGSGDSGGPSVIVVENKPYLVGLSSWQYLVGNIKDLESGKYGTKAYQTRISFYSSWIKKTIKEN